MNRQTSKFGSLIIIFLLLFSACSENLDRYTSRIDKIAKHEFDKFEQYIIIPGEGCGGCISGATYFVIENNPNLQRTGMIFTGVQDKKLLRNQLGSDFLNQSNVFVDSENLLMNKEVLSVYPYILKISSGQVSDLKTFDELSVKFDDDM